MAICHDLARPPAALAQRAPSQSPTPLPTRWYDDARFGLGIDCGVYTLVGRDEFVMRDDKLPASEYAKLIARFNPTRFNADDLVKLAKSSGAKYLTFTAKHPDGFCLFATALSDYDVVDGSPYRRDLVKVLAAACQKQQIKLILRYSLVDWHHPDYVSAGRSNHAASPDDKAKWARYIAYYQGQARELLTGYGELGGLWFYELDDRAAAEWDLASAYRQLERLQPGALLGVDPARPVLESDGLAPWKAIARIVANSPAPPPRELELPVADSRQTPQRDVRYKVSGEVIAALAAAAAGGANLRLILAPGGDGSIRPELGQTLVEIGEWLRMNGDAIESTGRGPIPCQPWGVCTAQGATDRPNRLFLHILDPRAGATIVFDRSFQWVPRLHGKTTPLKVEKRPAGLALEVPVDQLSPVDTIIVLDKK
jgi:alpha-L-fucosidase